MLHLIKKLFSPKERVIIFEKFNERKEQWFTISDNSAQKVKIKVGNEVEIVYDNKTVSIFTGHNNKNGNYFLCEYYNKYLVGTGRVYGEVVDKDGQQFKVSFLNPRIIFQKYNIEKKKNKLLKDKNLRKENVEIYHLRLEEICKLIYSFNKNYSFDIWISNPLNELTIVRKKRNQSLKIHIFEYLNFSKFTDKQIEIIKNRIESNK